MIKIITTSVLVLVGSVFAGGTFVPDKSVDYKMMYTAEGENLGFQVFFPKNHRSTDKRPVILFFFGGGWTGGTPKRFYQQARGVAKRGLVAISVDYRTKKSHGTTPFECVKDGKSAIRWVRQHADELGIDPNKIVAAGGSAGGHVAACTGVISGHEEEGEDLAISSLPNVMILYNPVIDTTEAGYGLSKVGEDRKTEISPCHHVRKGLPPTLIFHGTVDTTVPFENVERFSKLMKDAGNTCRLVPFNGKTHGFFNGSFFRPGSSDDDFNATMEGSLEFLLELWFPKTQKRPNIVFIMADDMGYGDPGCYNPESKIPTPNMDKLAKQGALFTDAHSSASVCTPSRYGALTGRYCWRTRLKKEVLWITFDEPLIEKDRMTVASLLKENGYTTACIGKWHLGMNFYKNDSDEFARGKNKHMYGKKGVKDVDFSRAAEYSPNDLGFDYSFISGAGHNMEPHCFILNRKPAILPTEWREAKTPTLPDSSGRESHEGWMSPGWIDENADVEFTKKTVEFIEQAHTQNPDKPFFIYLTPVAPHRPCVPTEEFNGETGVGRREDFVAQFDWTVGEVVKVLDRLKISDNTLIIVTSDNGAVAGGKGHSSSGKLKGKKSSLSEGGHRVPFIARWPDKIKKGHVNDTPLCLTGLLATCADLVQKKLPADAGEDSFSFLPALLGKENKNQKNLSIVHHSYFGTFAIRIGDWKLIPGGKTLFNMKTDPYEKTNLYNEQPEKVKMLSDALAKYKKSGRSR